MIMALWDLVSSPINPGPRAKPHNVKINPDIEKPALLRWGYPLEGLKSFVELAGA